MNRHTLTRHSDIQNWVSNHNGRPAIRRIPHRNGMLESRLALTFASAKAPPAAGIPVVDNGLSPCSWSAWLAELDRRHLALRVIDQHSTRFEFVERRDLH